MRFSSLGVSSKLSWLLACVIAIVLVSLKFQESESAKILSISFFSSKSHKITYERLILALAERGHEVTYVGPYLSGKKIKTLKEIQPLDLQALEKELNTGDFNPFDNVKLAKNPVISLLFSPFLFMGSTLERICRKSYELPVIQEVMKEKYDLIFFSPLFNECLYGLLYKLNTTTVLFTQITPPGWIAADLGTPSPPSFVPFIMTGLTDRMSYGERLLNFLSVVYNDALLKFSYYPRMESVYREYFKDPSISSISELAKNASIILANSHVSITRPRPLMPDVIDVGGLAMVPAKPIPKDLDQFIAGAGEHGFIYFSLGSGIKGSMMSDSHRKLFANVFSKLKQRVLWKWETEQMEGVPSNVKLSKWFPQPDLLGDKRCRLFITHGGHGSTSEAVYHGVPLIGMPFFGDQPANMKKAESMGFAIALDFVDLTEEALLNAINSILNDPKYSQSAKKLSTVFKDQIDNPLDRAIYWIEYVLRHGGAPHLRSAARDLSFIEYYSLDIIVTLLAVSVVGLILNFIILRAILRKCFGSKKISSKKGAGGAKKNK